MVWRSTEFMGLGFARAEAPDGSFDVVFVVYYDPAGNVNGQYKDNVLPSIKLKPRNVHSGSNRSVEVIERVP